MINSMKKTVARLSSTIAKILRSRGLENRLSEYRIFGQWEGAVGEVIARHAHPVAIRGKKLTLVVDSPAWMQQLSLLKPEIVGKVNQSIGTDAVRDIKLTLGEVMPSARPADTPPVPVNLDQEERMIIERYAREVNDADIRDAVRRVMEKDFLNRKKGRKK
jgi:hypothetical protein